MVITLKILKKLIAIFSNQKMIKIGIITKNIIAIKTQSKSNFVEGVQRGC
jgi:hypothetical protein